MKNTRGFTLVEVAIAVAILGFLLGGAMVTLGAQIDLKHYAETKRTMDLAQEAILGFASANGRLPCPAAPATGSEDPQVPPALPTANECGHSYDGFVPAAALALTPVNEAGQLVDAWNQPIRYAVTRANTHAFTTQNGVRDAFGQATLNDSDKLIVCAESPCVSALTEKAVFLLISSGKNRQIDHATNTDSGNAEFIYQNQTSDLDDVMVWTSPFTLYNRMLAAGAL